MSVLKFQVISGRFLKCMLSTSRSLAAAPIESDRISVKEKLIQKISKGPAFSGDKVTIIGLGSIGNACALSLVAGNLTSELCLIDKNVDRACGQVIDLQHAAQFANDVTVYGGDDFELSANSRICIISAGIERKIGESRLFYVDANAKIVKSIVENVMKHSKETIILMVSNPVDIMAYVAWKVSGLPRNKVFGLGTTLDSSRFKYLLSNRLKVAPSCIHAMVIGEHGDSCVPVWSGVNVAGTRLRDLDQCIGKEGDSENYHELKEAVRRAAYEVIDRIGYTASGPALCINAIVSAVLGNTKRVLPVCTHAKGFHSIEEDVFLSLPCALSGCGATSVVKLNLSKSEKTKLQKSAKILYKAQSAIKI